MTSDTESTPRNHVSRLMRGPTYVIITPVRDEQGYIADAIRSVAAQTIPVTEWVIVDDGSTDGTGALLDSYAREHRWISPIHLPNRGRRDADIGAIGAQSYKFSGNYDDDYGLGFRLNIPHLGPLRLDYGIPIRHDEYNGSSGQFQFGVGYTRDF